MAFNLGAFASGAASGAESFAKLYQTYDNIQTGKSVRDAMNPNGAKGALPAGTNQSITPTVNSDSAISGGAGSGSSTSSGWSTDGGRAVTAIDALPKPNYQQARSDSAASAPQQGVPVAPAASPGAIAPSDSAASAPSPPSMPNSGGRTNWRPPPQGTGPTPIRGAQTTTGPLIGSNQSRDPNTYLPPAAPGGQGTGRPPGRGLSVPQQAVPTQPPGQPPAPTLLPQQPGAMSQGQGIPTAPVSQTAMSGAPLPGGTSPGLAQQTQGLGARMAGYMGNSNYGGST